LADASHSLKNIETEAASLLAPSVNVTHRQREYGRAGRPAQWARRPTVRGEEMQLDPITIIFAFLALFVVWKLRSVLGERTGLEQSDAAPRSLPMSQPTAPAPINQGWTGFAEPGSPVWTGLDEVARAQPGFVARTFLDGASSAYEMLVQAFSRGDETMLHSLTSEEVYGSFAAALTDRKQRGDSLDTTLVGFNSTKIVQARVEQASALIAVRFDAQFITATRDRNGIVIEGDPNTPSNIVDIWTFARRNDASGPNWTLVATSPAQ
jgi:predicted lipid-binding transport protein (Tim44 family)